MGNRVWTSTTAVFFCLAPLCARAATPKYDNLVGFGDRYCDVGNIFAARGGAEPPAPYFNDRTSNGPVWLDHVAGFLSLPMKGSLPGSTNYVFGGARITVPQQLEPYVSQHGDTIRAEFFGNEYASSVGQLAHPFAAKIAGRLKEANLP